MKVRGAMPVLAALSVMVLTVSCTSSEPHAEDQEDQDTTEDGSLRVVESVVRPGDIITVTFAPEVVWNSNFILRSRSDAAQGVYLLRNLRGDLSVDYFPNGDPPISLERPMWDGDGDVEVELQMPERIDPSLGEIELCNGRRTDCVAVDMSE